MKSNILIAPLFFLLVLSSCSHIGDQHSTNSQREDDSLQQSPAETILNCLQNQWDLSRNDYKIAYKVAKNKFDVRQSDYNTLQLICFNVHPSAGYRQFRKGVKQLSKYIANHPSDTSGLGGLYRLLQQFDRERIVRWNLSNKSKEEKQNFNSENQELLESNQQLKREAEQDKGRIEELKKQIDQLKNIENIIKNREH
ncbi:MAG: hypothetical protein AB7U29_00040 [Desulfobulbus sp.]